MSLLFFVGGFYVMGSAFSFDAWAGPVFFAGIICCSVGLFIPAHILKRIDG